METGDAIRELREDAGLTQRELAAKAGVGYATVWSIEEHRRVPSFKTICKLAAALGVTVDTIKSKVWPELYGRQV